MTSSRACRLNRGYLRALHTRRSTALPVLSDIQWSALEEALHHARSRRGRPIHDMRRTVEAVVWRHQNGAKWRAVPDSFGPWHRAAGLHERWSELGVWERAFAYLRDAGRTDLADVMLDGTSVRAHQKAAGAKKGAP